jgi:dTDP-glucose 4,6-dehydratase
VHILVTGGAGFIGSNFVLHWLTQEESAVVNLDKLTYAVNLANLRSISASERHSFIKGDINDQKLLTRLLETYWFGRWISPDGQAEAHRLD